MARYSIKQGDTFAMSCAMTVAGSPQDLTGWGIASQVRSRDGALLSDLTVATRDDGAGTYILTADSTDAWPPGTVNWDIQYTDPSGNVRSTQTLQFPVLPDVTVPT